MLQTRFSNKITMSAEQPPPALMGSHHVSLVRHVLCALSFSLQLLTGTLVVLTLQVRKLRHRKVGRCAQEHTIMKLRSEVSGQSPPH